MIKAYFDEGIEQSPPLLHAVETEETLALSEGEQLKALASRMCDQSMLAVRVNAETGARVFDPLQGYRDLKFSLIGDVRPVARLNLHYPPGVERQTRRGRRVYGVECAVKVDTRTGELLIWRKDDIVDSADATDWFVATYNPVSGEFHERDVVMVDVAKHETGDVLKLQVAPVADPRNANRGHTTIIGQFSTGYHAVDDVSASRIAYYGRGVDPQANRIQEANYTADLYELHQALEEVLAARGLSLDLLDHAPDPRQIIGQYALAT